LNPWPLACHQQAARPHGSVVAGHRPRACAPVRLDPHRLLYFPAVPVSPAGQAPNERPTSQNLQEPYRGAPQEHQQPITLHESSKAWSGLASAMTHGLSPTAANPRSGLPAPPGLRSPEFVRPRLNARICVSKVGRLAEAMFGIRHRLCARVRTAVTVADSSDRSDMPASTVPPRPPARARGSPEANGPRQPTAQDSQYFRQLQTAHWTNTAATRFGARSIPRASTQSHNILICRWQYALSSRGQ